MTAEAEFCTFNYRLNPHEIYFSKPGLTVLISNKSVELNVFAVLQTLFKAGLGGEGIQFEIRAWDEYTVMLLAPDTWPIGAWRIKVGFVSITRKWETINVTMRDMLNESNVINKQGMVGYG